MMPHVDGLELCRAVKTGLGDEAPYFILLTAKDERRDRVEAFETGADDCLVKPCHSDEVVARARRPAHLPAPRGGEAPAGRADAAREGWMPRTRDRRDGGRAVRRGFHGAQFQRGAGA